MAKRRVVEPAKRRVVAGPGSGGVRDALTDLSVAIANSDCKGVVLAIQTQDGDVSYQLHGEFNAGKLALVALALERWAMGE